MDWDILLSLIPRLLEGLVVTIQVTIAALILGFIFGMSLGIGRVYGGWFVSRFAILYATIFRAIPPIVALFVLFFVISRFINLSPLFSGILALGLTSGAYQSEILRGAIQSVGTSQMLAARSIGMSRIKAIRYIILPQAIRIVIPSWSNEAALVLKNSSLVYALGIPEMLRQAAYVSARTYRPLLAYGSAAFIYFLLTILTNRGLNALEQKLKIPV